MASAAPAPPRRRGLPGWAWALIGCATLAILAAIAVIVGSLFLVSRVSREVGKVENMTQAQVEQRLGGSAVYPDSVYDEEASKGISASAAVGQALSGLVGEEATGFIPRGGGAYQSSDPPGVVIQWYDENNSTRDPRTWSADDANSQAYTRAYAGEESDMMVSVTSDGAGGSRIVILLIDLPELGGAAERGSPTSQ